jgi:hypothetical protein
MPDLENPWVIESPQSLLITFEDGRLVRYEQLELRRVRPEEPCCAFRWSTRNPRRRAEGASRRSGVYSRRGLIATYSKTVSVSVK